VALAIAGAAVVAFAIVFARVAVFPPETSPPPGPPVPPAPVSMSNPKGSRLLAIRALRVIPVVGEPIDHGVVLIRDGKIAAVGRADDVRIPEGCEVRDFPDGWATPGWVELHAHVGGTDINDMVYPTNPELRTLDTIVPNNPQLVAARQGGVTTMNFIPGSGTNMSGFGTLIKTAGDSVEEMTVRFPGALKIAQLGNPERRGGDVGVSRMGMNYLLRDRLTEAKAYCDKWDAWEKTKSGPAPAKDERYENFRGLFAHRFPVIVHTVFVNGIEATKRLLHDEFALDVIITHGEFGAFKAADVIVGAGLPVNVGPRLIELDRETGKILNICSLWKEAGCKDLSINTDCPVVPADELTTQAAATVHYGLDEKTALEGLTIVPARNIGMASRLGSLEPGKDADVVVRNGPPLDPRSAVLFVVVNGKPAYTKGKDRRWL
jgi:imidazolonepropionase-like amidohydrolase